MLWPAEAEEGGDGVLDGEDANAGAEGNDGAEDGAEEEDCRNSNGSNREKDPLWAEAGVSSAAAAQHRAGSVCNVLNDH